MDSQLANPQYKMTCKSGYSNACKIPGDGKPEDERCLAFACSASSVLTSQSPPDGQLIAPVAASHPTLPLSFLQLMIQSDWQKETQGIVAASTTDFCFFSQVMKPVGSLSWLGGPSCLDAPIDAQCTPRLMWPISKLVKPAHFF